MECDKCKFQIEAVLVPLDINRFSFRFTGFFI